MMPLVSPGQPARLIIDVEDQYRLVDAQDFSLVHGVSDAALFGGNVRRFLGDFNGDGVLDLGVVDYGHPVELYDGVDLSLMAIGPDPKIPSNSNEAPSGWPAEAIDADGDGIDEVVTVELGHDIGIWRVASGTLEPIAEHQDVMTPCSGTFLQADFDGDGTRELALPTGSCWDGLGLEDFSTFTIRLIPSPVPASLVELPAINQPNYAYDRAAGDLDGDGMADVVLADDELITLFRSNGVGFEPLESAEWVDLGAEGVLSGLTTVGDVDGDGRSEVLLSIFDETTITLGWHLYWEGTLQGASYAFPSYFRVNHIADLNGDGRAELIGAQIDPDVGREELIYWSQ